MMRRYPDAKLDGRDAAAAASPAGGSMIKACIPAALSGAMLLSGCVVGPDFRVPGTHVPAAYAAKEDSPMPSDQRLVMDGAPHGAWWQTFGSPALNSLVLLAFSDNQDVAAAKARVAEMQDQVASAEGALLPQASLGASVARQKYGITMFGPLNISVPPYTYYSVGPSLSFPLDLFGGERRTIEENKAYADYRGYELDATRLALAANVVAQSVMLASAKAQMASMGEIVAADRRELALLGSALDGGTASRMQLLAAEDQLATDEDVLPEIELQAATARHALAVLVGKAPADWAPPEISLNDLALPARIPAVVPSRLIHQRPDIRAAEAQLHAASAAIGVATADLYPKVDLAASYALQALIPGNLIGSNAAWSAAANVTQPLFNGGQLLARRRAAIDAYQAALAEYKQTILSSFGDVADRLQYLAKDADRVRAQTDAAQSAAEARDLARKAYAEGYANIFQVLAAERSASQSQMGLARALAQRLVDTAGLIMSMGGETGEVQDLNVAGSDMGVTGSPYAGQSGMAATRNDH